MKFEYPGTWLVSGMACCFFLSPASMMAQATASPAVLNAALSSPILFQPLSAGAKFRYHMSQSFSLSGFLIPGFTAGIAQATNVPREWGGGGTAYSYRYASAFGDRLGLHLIDSTLESALHEDPRYFRSQKTTAGGRFTDAVLHAVIARTDSGGERFAFARVTSAVASGQLTNVWQPYSTGHASDGFIRAGITLGQRAGVNLLHEFFPKLTDRFLK
jgi:hypothetical protein